jgi:hypothetical protein
MLFIDIAIGAPRGEGERVAILVAAIFFDIYQ